MILYKTTCGVIVVLGEMWGKAPRNKSDILNLCNGNLVFFALETRITKNILESDDRKRDGNGLLLLCKARWSKLRGSESKSCK